MSFSLDPYKENLMKLIDRSIEKLPPMDKQVLLYGGCALAGVSVAGAALSYSLREKHTPLDQYEPFEEKVHDVGIVGAGPSGSSLAWYLRTGNRDLSVLLFEKKKFPRDKHCGDAVATMAQKHLIRMGVLQEIMDEGLGHMSQSGGFVSPNGNSFVGNSAKELDLGDGAVVVAIKRIVLDERIAKAAAREGALLTEDTTVDNAVFLKEKGVWRVECTDTSQGEGKPVVYYVRCLVCADGAPSRLGRQLGLVKTEPQGTCSRAYVKDNKDFKFDGVVFYPRQLLPGYCAIFREAKGELNFCTYIIPGGPTKNDDLPAMHDDIMKNDPFVSKSLGPNPNIERMKSGSLRFGGIDKSYSDHLMIIGDAAGFIDPLTGEGIQYAMESGEMASKVLLEAFKQKDLSAPVMKKYHKLWKSEWGWEFYMSMKMSLFLYRFPIVLDAAAKMIAKRGSRFMAEWAQVMTGTRPKTWFLRFDVWPVIVLEIFAQMYRNITGKQ